MKTKPKKCKGTGKATGYGCGAIQQYRRYGLGLHCGCYTDWLLKTPEGKEVINKSRISAKRKVEKIAREKDRETKESYKSIAKVIQEVRKIYHEYIRLRDINDACISCQSTTSEIWDAGHYYKAELYTGLIFDEINTNKQCRKCNTFLDGNESGYIKGLERKYGQHTVSELQERSNTSRTYKFTREELKALKTLYRAKVKQLKSNYLN